MPKIPRRKKRSKKHPLYPEPGAGILDTWNGLSKMECPEPIRGDAKLSAEEIDLYIMYEGLGYCIFEYISSGKIADPTLRKFWEEAREAMMRIIELLDDLPPKRKKKVNHKRRRVNLVETIEGTEEL